MSPHHFKIRSESPYSLIIDLEGKKTPLGVTMGLHLGTVINRLHKEFICIGSGEILGGINTYNLEEIRAYIVRNDDLNLVRNIFRIIIQRKSSIEANKEVFIKGLLGTHEKESSIIGQEAGDIIISLLKDNKEIKIRFIEKNLRFVKGLSLNQEEELNNIPVYVHGLALIKGNKQWEIQGRALITVE